MKKILVCFMLVGCTMTSTLTKHVNACVVPILTKVEVQKKKLKNAYDEKKSENQDYVGHFVMGNHVIDQIVAQGEDNEFYLTHDFNRQSYPSGTIFMDYRNTLDDQNIILYGHYVYKDETRMFSPLHLLKTIEGYELNHQMTLQLEDEIRHYIVAEVFYFDLNTYNVAYYLTHIDDFEQWYQTVKDNRLIETGVKLTSEDKLLTLQTCVRNRNDLRLIVIAKEVENEIVN